MLTVFLSLILAGIDPFVPAGSILIADFAILGLSRQGGGVIPALILSGLLRDVLLVEPLGTSGLILSLTWVISALAITKLERPFLVSTVSSALGTLVLALVEHHRILPALFASVAFTLILLLTYRITSSWPENKIKLN